jgi:hypothetical protein
VSIRDILSRLDEATFAIRGDVDIVYGRSGLFRVGQAQRVSKAELIGEASNWPLERVQWEGRSHDLQSEDAMRAHATNPVRILVGVTKGGSFYMPEKKIISISLNVHVMRIFEQFGYRADADTIKTIDSMVGAQGEQFWKELSVESIRGTIAHELSHWMDDSLHHGHLRSRLAIAKERSGVVDTKFHSVGQEPFELNAQIHAVRDIQTQMGDAFDRLTWRDLLTQKTSLAANLVHVGSEAEYTDVMRRFVKRLNREGLLGSGLRRIPRWAVMKSYSRGEA